MSDKPSGNTRSARLSATGNGNSAGAGATTASGGARIRTDSNGAVAALLAATDRDLAGVPASPASAAVDSPVRLRAATRANSSGNTPPTGTGANGGSGASHRAMRASTSMMRSSGAQMALDIQEARQSIDGYHHLRSEPSSKGLHLDDLATLASTPAAPLLTPSMTALADSGGASSEHSLGRYPMLQASPPLPPDSTISAEDVIRESLASSRSTQSFSDRDDLFMSRRSDSLTFSFSSRSTFRRSTISEQMLRESELFEPERDWSVHDLSEVLSASATNVMTLPMTSIMEEEQDAKLENAKSRWAQHVKLRARNFLFPGMASGGAHGGNGGGGPSGAPAAGGNGGGGGKRTLQPPPQATIASSAFVSPETHEWAAQQKALLTQMHRSKDATATAKASAIATAIATATANTTSNVLGAAPGTAKLHKLNRWMHDYFTAGGQESSPTEDPSLLLSLEEVVSNPRMMRYYAAWLHDPADQSKLFFLCSFEEYRQFWCTLRANYYDAYGSAWPTTATTRSSRSGSGSNNGTAMFSKDDILMLRTYGVKIATKYLTKGAQFHIGSDFVDSDALRRIKRDIAAGGEDALRTYDRIVTRVKRALMARFPAFRKTELFSELRLTVAREVICLEDILMNHRFANFFWTFLFPHHYHREIAFWLDVEYEFKPAYRAYIALRKAHQQQQSRHDRDRDRDRSRRRAEEDAASRQCRRLIRYLCAKYYPGDDEMRALDQSVTRSLPRLQHEQDAILAKFSLIHLELYHRFLTSHAYTEFALYSNNDLGGNGDNDNGGDDDASMDDLRRISGLLLSYGLRAHHWPDEASREAIRKRSLEVLQSARGYEAICGILTFDAALPTAASSGSSSVENTAAKLRVMRHPLPHDPSPMEIERSIESFLLPWWNDMDNVVVHSATCPSPVAFNFKMGDSTSSNELYAACVVLYKPAPPLPVRLLETVRLDTMSMSLTPSHSPYASRWTPYGVCILSKYPLVDVLRERLAEAYEHIIEREAMTGANKDSSFLLDKKVLSMLSRSVSLDQTSTNLATPATPSASASLSSVASVAAGHSTAMATPLSVPMPLSLPLLDHSVRIVFDTMDVNTVIQIFTAVLLECRVVVVSSYWSVLMRVCDSLRALLFPLLWPHVYLPVLPRRMLPYLECPTPFLFGVSQLIMQDATRQDLISDDDIVVVDVDKGVILRGAPPATLPAPVHYALREGLYECLKSNITNSDHVFAHRFPTHTPGKFPDHTVRQLFARTVRSLLGDFGYHRYTWTDELSRQKTVVFDEASYLAASTPETRDFRTLFSATQAFSEFVVSFHGFEDVVGTGGDDDRGKSGGGGRGAGGRTSMSGRRRRAP